MRPTLLTFMTLVSCVGANCSTLASTSVNSNMESHFSVQAAIAPLISYDFQKLPGLIAGHPLGVPIVDVKTTLVDPSNTVVAICTNSNSWSLWTEDSRVGHFSILTSEIRPNAQTWVWAMTGGPDKCMSPTEFNTVNYWRIKPGGLFGGFLPATRYKLKVGFTMYTK